METATYTLAQFEAALAGVGERRSTEKAGAPAQRRKGARRSMDDPGLWASRPERVVQALEAWPNNAETNPLRLDFVRAIAAIKTALGPKREDYYGCVLKWSFGYARNDGKFVREIWDSIKDSELGAEWLFAQARPFGFCGDAQDDFAEPPYDPESFCVLDADVVRARIELLILKLGYPEAYQHVRDYLETMGVIDLVELDALINTHSPAYGIAIEREGTPSAGKMIEASPFTWQDPATIPRREWLYGRHMARKHMSATVAPGGLGKSALAIAESLAMVTGKDLLGDEVIRPLRVWYMNLEDPADELQRRFIAACLHYKIAPKDIGDRLFVTSGRDVDIVIARDDRHGVQLAKPVIDALREELIAKQIDVLIIDPFVASHGVPENDNGKINQVCGVWRTLAEEMRCAIELVHHVRKAAPGQSEYSVDDARGAGAMIAAARSARTLNRMSKNEAKKIGITDHWRYFRVDNGKGNNAPPPDKTTWRRLISKELGNGATIRGGGDSVGVVTPWEWSDQREKLTPDEVRAVQEAVAAGEWRRDSQAKKWVGKAIAEALGLDLDEPSVRAWVKELQRSWEKSGELKVVERQTSNREMKEFVIVGDKIVQPGMGSEAPASTAVRMEMSLTCAPPA